jgi:hypothetical protein
MECSIDEWDTVRLCFSRRLNGNKLNHLADGTFASLKQLQRLYAIPFNSRIQQKKYFIIVFFYLTRDVSSNRLRAIKKGMLQGLQEIDNL